MSKQSVIDSIRAKMARLNGENENTKWFWSPPKSGEEVSVRILPYSFATDPFNELYFHYNLGKGGAALCPKQTFGGDEECPICDFCDTLMDQARIEYRKGNKENQQYKQAMSIMAKLRVHTPIVVRGKESEGPKFWAFSETVYTTITAFYLNKTYGELQDVYQGRDLTVKALKKQQGQKYDPAPSVVVEGVASPLSEDKVLAANLIKAVPNVFGVVTKKSAVELKVILESYIESISPSSEQELNSDIGKLKTASNQEHTAQQETQKTDEHKKDNVEKAHTSGEADDIDDFLSKFGESK